MSSDPLPLFPLRTVLLPRMPLRLHVFEDRYQKLVRRCLGEDRPFGVTLIREGSQVGPAAIPHSVGTLARILAVENLAEGRMNLLTVGTDRFRLLEYCADAEPYLVGATSPLRDEPADAAGLAPLQQEIRCLFQSYLDTLFSEAGVDVPDYDLPDDAEEFSFVIAAVVKVDQEQRQGFLEMSSTAARLNREREILEGELARLRTLCVRSSRWKPYLSRN